MSESSKNRKNKSISFDLTDEFEKSLLEHAEKEDNGRFSRYIKRLIADDKGRSNVIEQDANSQSIASPRATGSNRTNESLATPVEVDISNDNSKNDKDDVNKMSSFL